MRNLTTNKAGRRLPTGQDFLSRFDSFFNDFEREFNNDRAMSERRSDTFGDFNPAVDIEESEGMYMISADLPGIKRDDIKIDVNNNTLRISGERRREVKDEDSSYYERSQGRFVRSFTLPEAIEAKKIEAHFEDGVLRIVLPKTEVTAPQQVKVQSGSPTGLLDRFLNRKGKDTDATKPVDRAAQN